MLRLQLYIATVMHLKPSQVFSRVWRRLGGRLPLRFSYTPKVDISKANIESIPVLPELDFDPVFLERFDVEAILNDCVALLHHEERVDWRESWHDDLSTPLWRFNLHYHEYLLPLAKAFLDTDDVRYLDKAKAVITNWIASCPRDRGGVAWEPYVVAMRAVNWLAFLGELSDKLSDDEAFVARVNSSLAEQHLFLSQHLEKDLLANHYLEDLKALVLLSCYFNDDKTLVLALSKLFDQINEQILPDGMHFELSPMYHKIVLEDLLRAAVFLESRGYDSRELIERFRLQNMCDTLYSLERNTNRTPLFNDSGDNVAKSRDALLTCAHKRFGVLPVYKSELPDAGYAILERETAAGNVKIIFDAGMPGPSYAMGHSHCDALSIEVFIDGEPWIVNGGTYAYQDERRLDYKRTLSHSAVRVGAKEQHECWAPFRVAGYSLARLVCVDMYHAEGFFIQRDAGTEVKRSVSLEEDGIVILDETNPSCEVESAFVFTEKPPQIGDVKDRIPYAPDFGSVYNAYRVIAKSQNGQIKTAIPYSFPK